MSDSLLRQCGEALYGAQWQTALSGGLGVSARTMRRWVAGEDAVPTGVRGDLERMMQVRAGVLIGLVDQIKSSDG